MDVNYIEHVLGDIHYPIDKQQLLQEVEKKGASEIKPLLEKLPDQKFGSVEEIIQKISAGSMSGLMSDL